MRAVSPADHRSSANAIAANRGEHAPGAPHHDSDLVSLLHTFGLIAA